MEKDDKQIFELFRDFNPELSSDDAFMRKTMRNIAIADTLKKSIRADKRYNRYAMAVSLVAGFILGVLSTIFYPYIFGFVNELIMWANPAEFDVTGQTIKIVTWVVIAFFSAVCVFPVYDIVLATLTLRNRRNPVTDNL